MSQVRVMQWIRHHPLVWFGFIMVWLGAAAIIRPLALPDEGRYVGIAWEMVTSGNWFVPHLDGLPYFHKPPLFYWMTAASLKACGPTLLCSRVAPLLSALALAIGLLWFLSRHLDKKTAVVAFVALLTQPFFFASAQFANLDMLVASMISLTIMMAAAFVWQLEQGQFAQRYLFSTYGFAAAGLLAKGLIGVVLPGAVILLWLGLSGRLRMLKSFFWWPAIVVFALLVSPWFLFMEAQFKGFLNYFFVHHHFQRFTGTDFNNQEPFWFYVPALLILTLPSSFWLLKFRLNTFQQWSPRQQDLLMLMVCWIGFILVFFSIPTSKPLGYIMPVLPAMAVIASMLMVQAWPDAASPKRSLWVTLVVAVLACIIAIATIIHHAQRVATYQMGIQAASVVAKDDQLLMIGKYRFDLPFYLHLQRPAWILADWPAAVNAPLADSWEKELLEAQTFDPQAGAHQLLSDDTLLQQVCLLAPHQALWVVGDAGSPRHFDALATATPLVNVRGHLLWRLAPAEIHRNCTMHQATP